MAGLSIDSVPTARLGRLLRAARRRRGLTLRAVARLTGLPRGTLLAYERGWDRVTPNHLDLLVDHYGGTIADLVPQRSPVRMCGTYIDAVGHVRILASPARDDVLRGHLALVARMRHTRPRAGLVLRTSDLEALAESLGDDVADLEARIAELLGCTRDEARVLHSEMLRRRIIKPAAGLALGATFAGAMAIAPAQGSAAAPAAETVESTTSAATSTTTAVPASTTATTSTTTAVPASTTTAPPPEVPPPDDPPATTAPEVPPPDDPPVSIPPGETFVEIGEAAVAGDP